jgi:hypothetical protein
MERINYKGWPNCYRLANGTVDLVMTTDVGPRIIRFGLVGRANQFKEYAEMLGQTGGCEWRIYGGHRLWHAPEVWPRTYCPDNAPVRVESLEDAVRLIQRTEPETGIQKELDVQLWPNAAAARVTHRLRNNNSWPIELAPWALSVMAPAGKAIIPLPLRETHAENLSPVSTIILWAYTDMSDPRFTWGHNCVLVRQDPGAETPQKIGATVPDGWVAYARDGQLFVKQFACDRAAHYPDFGACVEVWVDTEMLELETLGPLRVVEPGGAVEHVEQWFLLDGVSVPATEEAVIADVLPRVRDALRLVHTSAGP